MNRSPSPRSPFASLASSPVSFVFAASLLLSAIAVATAPLNRDGMLYAEAAKAFIAGGLPASEAIFAWPFLPALMGMLSLATGLSPEWCGHFLNMLFMSGACALMVAMIRETDQELAWLGAITILALPGLNEHRNELLREYGCWFFVMLSLWLARRWPEDPSLRRCLAIQSSIVLAALFRPEALVFYPCILLWQQFQDSPSPRLKRALMLAAVPTIGLIAILAVHFSGMPTSPRISSEIGRFDFAVFDRTAREMAKAFHPYAREQAKTAHAILFFGSLALIPWNLLGKFGLFLLPLWFFVSSPERSGVLRRHTLLPSALIAHLLVLSVFVLKMQFISGRYFGPILLLSTPYVAFGLKCLLDGHARWRTATLALCGAIAVANVISLNPNNQHFTQAGRWLSGHATDSPRVYLDSSRTAYYAGWRYAARHGRRLDDPERTHLKELLAQQGIDLVVIEVPRREKDIDARLTSLGLVEIQRFTNRTGDAVLIAVPKNAR